MEDVLKDLAGDAIPAPAVPTLAPPEPPIAIEPPNNNLRDVGILIGVVVAAAVCYKLYLATEKVKNE